MLLLKGDPKGNEEKEVLEREVNCLESYLEALPSLCVIGYLMRDNPRFLKTLGLFSFYRPYFQTCFTMTLFLKSGPCFMLPRRGLFGGIFTWRFFAMFGLNQISFKIKFKENQFNGETYIVNAVCVSTFGVVLGLVSIHRAAGSWKAVFSLLLKFPPLLFLPIFGFVTFGANLKGKAKDTCIKSLSSAGGGLAIDWSWTWVNFVVSLLINRLRFLVDEGLYHLHTWLTHHPDAYPVARHVDFYATALFSAALLALFHLRPLIYGVLLPSMPGVAHILQNDQVVPLVDVPSQGLTRKVCLLQK